MKMLKFGDTYKEQFSNSEPYLSLDGVLRSISDLGDMPDKIVFSFEDYLDILRWDKVVKYDIETRKAYLFGIIELAYE